MRSAAESVDELAKLEQIAELAERRCAITIVMERRSDDVGRTGSKRKPEADFIEIEQIA